MDGNTNTLFNNLATTIRNVAVAVGVFAFMWGAIQYAISGGSPRPRCCWSGLRLHDTEVRLCAAVHSPPAVIVGRSRGPQPPAAFRLVVAHGLYGVGCRWLLVFAVGEGSLEKSQLWERGLSGPTAVLLASGAEQRPQRQDFIGPPFLV